MMAPDLTDVLAAVNRIRAERGLGALSEMPKEDPDRSRDWRTCGTCPMTVALDAWITAPDYNGKGTGRATLRGENTILLPAPLGSFMEAFDRGEYPELKA